MLGSLIYRRRWTVLVVCGLFLAGALTTLLRGGRLSSSVIHGLEAERAQELIEQILGHSLETTVVVIFEDSQGQLTPEDQAFQDAQTAALAPLRHDPRVSKVTTADEAPSVMALDMANAHGSLALVEVAGDFRGALAAWPQLRAELRSDRLAIACTGKLAYVSDLNRTLDHDLIRAELLSLPLALLVLLLVFRTWVAAVLPVAVGGLAVVGGIAVVLAVSSFVEIAQYTVNVCSLIGLGVAIDYSLFTVARYREELAVGDGVEAALGRAVAHAGRVVAFSGVAVGAGLGGLLFFEGSFLWAMGLGGAIVVGLAVLFAITLLPALLAVLGTRIEAGRLPFVPVRRGEGAWRAISLRVMRRPVAVLLPTLALLLTMGTPFLHLRVAAADARVLDPSVEARRAYDLLGRDFPDQGQNRILIAVRFPTSPALTAPRIGAIDALSQRLAALPHVTRVRSLTSQLPVNDRAAKVRMLLDPPPLLAASLAEAEKLSVGERGMLVSVEVDRSPDSPDAQAVVREIRAERAVADGALLVGGQTANDLDTQEYILARTPRAVGFVVLITGLALFFLLGSVVLPLKAILMNLVSISGSFGAMVWIFQDGHLFIRDPRPLEPVLPVLLFCVLFGLSMDYEVLMLSRIKEAYERTGDNTQAVAEGLEKTAGLITSAAAIMVSVFAAFALASVVIMQAVGLGMALAVALDATLVRVLLVPATMRLFGDLNWWAPRWCLRLRKAVGGEALH